MPQKYEAIIFDLGGVLYDIDVQRTKDAFAALGLHNFDDQYTLNEQTLLFDALEKGEIGKEEFTSEINRIDHTNLSLNQVQKAWNALLIGMPEESVSLLKNLRQQGYALYLLSNTNQFHADAINREMNDKFGIESLDELFDAAYYSYRMGMRKPDIEIYKHIINNHNLKSESTVFIDDNEDNIKGALRSGIQAKHKPKDVSLNDLMNQLLK
jgi:putative hydrolase of the HAD superfamily